MLDKPKVKSLRPNMALFALGCRPFFLGAGIAGLALMAMWLGTFVRGEGPASYYGPVGWHSHEVLFGYTAAVVAGFLLTAVANWTNMPTLRGAPLLALTARGSTGAQVEVQTETRRRRCKSRSVGGTARLVGARESNSS